MGFVLVDYPPAGPGAGDPGDTDIAYTYDALGRLAARTDAAGAWAWTYDGDSGRVLTVTDPGGNVVSYTYDAAGQRAALALAAAGQQQPMMELDYTYAAGRLTGIATAGTAERLLGSFSYSYLPNSSLLESVVSNNGTADVLTLTRTYDDAGRLATVSSGTADRLVGSFSYGLDSLGRRISRTDLDGSRTDYTYNARDELTGAVRSNQPAAAPFGEYPYNYAYEFDRIGNHLRQTKNGTEFRGRYNSLNELTERELAGAVRVQGAVDGVLPIGVKVDGRDAQTQNVDTDTAAFRGDSPLRPRQTGEKAISIVATDSNQPPKRTEAVRTVQLPTANPVRYTYDANGNLLSDGVWTYTWTTECRLLRAEGGNLKAEYVYDGEGRRRRRKAYSWDAQAEAWVLASETTFVYDGWNLIAEFSPQLSSLIPQRTYVWGLDLSQSLQGAGGVGGLLSVASASSSSFVAYDGNGNVVALVDASTAAVAAEYDYSPFGETLKAAGPAAHGNPFRFSTKYFEGALPPGSPTQPSAFSPQPSLYYYGYRYYSTGLGRWASRDPLEEDGGHNLFAFVGGQPVVAVDPLGEAVLWNCVACAAAIIGEIGGTVAGCALGCSGAGDYAACLGSCLLSQYSPCELWNRLGGNPIAWVGAAACVSCGVTVIADLISAGKPDDCCPKKPPEPVTPKCNPCVPPVGYTMNRRCLTLGHGCPGEHTHHAYVWQLPATHPTEPCKCVRQTLPLDVTCGNTPWPGEGPWVEPILGGGLAP
jgi:RHS repeat-associated protein